MPLFLILVGLVLVITSIQNTYAALGAQVQKDFLGSQGFLVWILAIIAVGALGYVSGWEKFSRWFLALILIAIILAQSKNNKAGGGVFGSFLNQIRNPKSPPQAGGNSSSIFTTPTSPDAGQVGSNMLGNATGIAGNLNAWLANPNMANWNKFLFGK